MFTYALNHSPLLPGTTRLAALTPLGNLGINMITIIIIVIIINIIVVIIIKNIIVIIINMVCGGYSYGGFSYG